MNYSNNNGIYMGENNYMAGTNVRQNVWQINTKNGTAKSTIFDEKLWKTSTVDFSNKLSGSYIEMDYFSSVVCTMGTNKRSKNASNYSEDLIEFVKRGEGLSLTPYNKGKTIGYGFDYYLRSDIKINWNLDGSITDNEAERLLRIILDELKVQLNNYLDVNKLTLDQNAYDSAIDLLYNRNSNALTKEVVVAMASKDDKRVQGLLSDFDYRYALKYIYDGDISKSQPYVDRNPGLKIRRNEEFEIYKNGF